MTFLKYFAATVILVLSSLDLMNVIDNPSWLTALMVGAAVVFLLDALTAREGGR